MKKSKEIYELPQPIKNILAEDSAHYIINDSRVHKEVLVKDFNYEDFKKVADKSPFTLNDWATFLYMSERTLHRYAKEESAFNGLQIERIIFLEQLIDAGNELFGENGFKAWIGNKPYGLGGATVKELLLTHEGIQEVIDLIGKMQYGIPA